MQAAANTPSPDGAATSAHPHDFRPCAEWHRIPAEEALRRLATRPGGLTHAEARQRLARHGPNTLEEPPPRSLLALFAAQFADFMILTLIAAAAISGLIGDLVDTIAIAAIVVLNAALGSVQELRAERALAALKSLSAPVAKVIREHRSSVIAAADLVPGDIVLLEAGQIVPADLRLVDASGLLVDESMLTGESVPVGKSTDVLTDTQLPVAERRNLAHKGTVVAAGRGIGAVFATGMETELGRIARLLEETRVGKTPLQRRLTTFGQRLALVVLFICAIVFVTGLLRGEPLLLMFLTALSLAVAAIPEALPAVVSIALALGARRLVANKALIRRLPAVETLGSVTYICSDKTGTLTANQMRVDHYLCDGEQTQNLGTSAPWRMLRCAMTVSHDAVADRDGQLIGDPTEVALLRGALAADPDARSRAAGWARIAEIPFDADRKCMTTIHRADPEGILSITKGAAEVIIDRSVREQRGHGTVPIDRSRLRRAAETMAEDGLRVLAVGVRYWESLPARITSEAVEHELEFVGLIALVDPPRPEAREAVATCRAAGIVPVMVTGDHPATARAVARRLGILDHDHDGLVLSGGELAAMPQDTLERRADEIRVYARVTPAQKVRILTALQNRGELVAVTGDGVNDAPALKRADIGVAMGLAGTDVARAASDMVLLDDNFATVVRAVREGRRIYDNLRRFVRYILTTNSAEIWTIFLAPFLGLPIPLLPIQILWINLVSDGLPGITLAAEPAERNVMQRPPRPPGESLFARGLGVHALLVGLLMAALTLGVQAWLYHADSASWRTMAFTTLCFTQLGHVLAVRSEETPLLALGITSNRPLFAAIVLTVVLQLAVVYVPALNTLFHTVPLEAAELAVCTGSAIAIILVVEIEKWARLRLTATRQGSRPVRHGPNS